MKCLGQARSWGMPFKMLGTGPLLGQIRTKKQIGSVDIQLSESRKEGGDLDTLWDEYESEAIGDLPEVFLTVSTPKLKRLAMGVH